VILKLLWALTGTVADLLLSGCSVQVLSSLCLLAVCLEAALFPSPVVILCAVPEVPELFTNTALSMSNCVRQLYFLSIISVSKSLECIEKEKKIMEAI